MQINVILKVKYFSPECKRFKSQVGTQVNPIFRLKTPNSKKKKKKKKKKKIEKQKYFIIKVKFFYTKLKKIK